MLNIEILIFLHNILFHYVCALLIAFYCINIMIVIVQPRDESIVSIRKELVFSIFTINSSIIVNRIINGTIKNLIHFAETS